METAPLYNMRVPPDFKQLSRGVKREKRHLRRGLTTSPGITLSWAHQMRRKAAKSRARPRCTSDYLAAARLQPNDPVSRAVHIATT